MSDSDCSIFISHAAVDEEIALALKSALGTAFPNQHVFVSSDPSDLKLGDEWVPRVLAALEKAKVVLIIATERGLTRKWVWFEAGRTWFSSIDLLPCCVGKIRKANLPQPFSDRMSANIDEARGVEQLFAKLQESFKGSGAMPDFDAFAMNMARLDVRAEERARVQDDPFEAERMQSVESQMSKLNPAERETIRQFVIFGELSTGASRQRVKDAGMNMAQWSVPSHLERTTGFLIGRSGNTPYDNMEANLYLINPSFKDLLSGYFARQR